MINQYSFLIASCLLIGLIAVVSWSVFGRKYGSVAIVLISVLLVSVYFSMTSNDTRFSNAETFERATTSGKPFLIEFYSDFWIACLASKPAVDRLESQLTDKLIFIRLDIGSRFGKEIRKRYNGGAVPTFVIFDSDGTERLRISGKVPTIESIYDLDLF